MSILYKNNELLSVVSGSYSDNVKDYIQDQIRLSGKEAFSGGTAPYDGYAFVNNAGDSSEGSYRGFTTTINDGTKSVSLTCHADTEDYAIYYGSIMVPVRKGDVLSGTVQSAMWYKDRDYSDR